VTLSLLSVNPAYLLPILGAKNSDDYLPTTPLDDLLIQSPASFKYFMPYFRPLLAGCLN